MPDADLQPEAPETKPNTHSDKQETFSREYVRELREENKSWRLKNDELAKNIEAEKQKQEKAISDANERVTNEINAANERIKQSELKAHALKAGIIDLDGLKLADLSKVSIGEDGEIVGADTLIKELQESKPYLFKEYKTSSGTKAKPDEKPITPKSAKDMTGEEYKAAKEQLLRK